MWPSPRGVEPVLDITWNVCAYASAADLEQPVNNLPRTRGTCRFSVGLNQRKTNENSHLHEPVNRRVAGSSPARGATHFGVYSGDMGNSFGPKGLSIGSSLQVWRVVGCKANSIS